MFELKLDLIASYLEGLEDTIILKFIDRAQYRRNPLCYLSGKSGFAGAGSSSLLDLRLAYQEKMDAEFGRFVMPEERPFTDGLPAAKRRVIFPPSELWIDDYNLVNLTSEILAAYLDFIPDFCEAGDDGQYGSSVEHDVHALQAVSRRIHFGAMYVAESKYRSDSDQYQRLIDRGDRQGLMERLTRKEVELRILDRVKEKVEYIQKPVNRKVRIILNAEAILEFYKNTVIPLTKEGQVRYLLHRKTERN